MTETVEETTTTGSARLALLSRIVTGNAAAMQRLSDAGIDVAVDLAEYDAMGIDEWHARLAAVEALVVGMQPVDAALFDAAAKLRYVLRVGTGMDNVDVAEAQRRGVHVANLAGMNAGAVAEYAFALLLAAARRVRESDASVRSGKWERLTGKQLAGSTLGLIGFGEIARAMVPKALGFGMDVVVARRDPAPIDIGGVRRVELDELLSTAGFVSVHVPLTPQTRGLIGAREIALLRGAVLVNTARGGVVDERALYDGLVSGSVAAAGLDVFADEPPAGSPLLTLPNVVVSAHTAAYTDRTTDAIAHAVVDGVLEALHRG